METRTSELVTLNVALSTLCHNIRLKLFHLKLREHIVRSKLDSSQNSDPPTGGPSFKLLIGLSVSRLIASAWVPDSNSVIAATVLAARRQRCFLIKFGGGAGDGRCSFHSSWHNSLECPYDAIHLIRHSIDPSMMWEWILSSIFSLETPPFCLPRSDVQPDEVDPVLELPKHRQWGREWSWLPPW